MIGFSSWGLLVDSVTMVAFALLFWTLQLLLKKLKRTRAAATTITVPATDPADPAPVLPDVKVVDA
ncbi:hypothetical protein A2U01_0037221 [Trifolium medium]|uniref:Uncharacterized protein n=1 Tax=Trifolium medium TaxID=97028 RepID=A0A392PXB1_9FABA|nr:hypothetical protein [Trifolium medium]